MRLITAIGEPPESYARVEPLKVFLSESAAHWEKNESPFSWLLCLKGTDRPIGSIGVTLEKGKTTFSVRVKHKAAGEAVYLRFADPDRKLRYEGE